MPRAGFCWSAASVIAALLPVLSVFPGWFAGLLLAIAALGTWLGIRRVKLPQWLRLGLTAMLAAAAMASAGFTPGQSAGAALLAAMLSLKLLETTTLRDGRSACSFALFAIIAGFLQDQGPRTLMLALMAAIVITAALGWLAAHETPEQIALERDDLEKQALDPIATNNPFTRHIVTRQLKNSRALLALSLPLAFAAFFLFPRFPSPLWGSPNGADSARVGLSDDVEPGDFVELLLDGSPALRVTFDGPVPPRSAMYWRGPVMSQFDGRKWSRWEGDAFAQPAALEHADDFVSYEVTQEPASHSFLLALDIATQAPEGARASQGRTLNTRPSNNLRRFRATSALRYALEPQLDESHRRHATATPPDSNPRTRQLIGQWRTENPAPEALILRALTLFNAQFSYSLSPPPLAGRDRIDDFLFNTKTGYCEHFASAFAAMMRMSNIPARVVTGYQGGEFNPMGNYWLVRQSDAHAWTEVWLQDRGWVRVDPTAAIAPDRIEQGQSAVAREPSAFFRYGRPLLQAMDYLHRGWNDFILDFDAQRQRDLLRRLGMDWSDWRQIGLALGTGIALALILTFALLLRGARTASTPLASAWNRFLARLAKHGAQKRMDETATAFARRLPESLAPEDANAAVALIDRYTALAYAPHHDAATMMRELIRALRRFRTRHTQPSTKNPKASTP